MDSAFIRLIIFKSMSWVQHATWTFWQGKDEKGSDKQGEKEDQSQWERTPKNCRFIELMAGGYSL